MSRRPKFAYGLFYQAADLVGFFDVEAQTQRPEAVRRESLGKGGALLGRAPGDGDASALLRQADA